MNGPLVAPASSQVGGNGVYHYGSSIRFPRYTWKATNYFVDIGQIPVFREVRDRYIDTKAPPASTAVQVGKLAAPEYLFEIEAIAVVPEK